MEGMEDFRRIAEDTGRLSRLEPIRRVMSEASEYYGDAILKGVGDMARDAREDPESAMCLGRMLVVGEESDRDILAAADLFESAADDSRTAEDWLMFLEGQHPEWVTRGAKGGFHSYGMGPFEMPNPEWGVLLDLCVMPLCETSYQRFRNADGGFENGQFMTRPELRFDSDLGLDEHTWEEWLRITFVFKPTGFAYRGIRVDEEDASWFHPMEDHSANQRISGTDAAHMLRLCIESVMESIREGCA